MPRINPVFTSLRTYPAVRLDQMREEVIARGQRLFDFGTGDPVMETPDFIRQACLDAIQPICGYPRVAGKPEARAAMAAYLERRFGLSVDPDTQIIPTAGSKEACFHTPLLVIDKDAPDNVVLFPDPGYAAYQRGALFAGADAQAVHLAGDMVFRPWELDTDLLRRTRMMWVNNPHNPTGAVTGLDDLRRIAELCVEYDILCVCDETYADIYQDVVPHSMLEAGLQNILVLHSLSKRSGMTGYRSGFLAGDPDVIAPLKSLRANPGCVPQDFVNAAAAAAWMDDDHVAGRRVVFAEKKQLFVDFFAEVGIELAGSDATIYLWLKVPEGVSDEDYAARLLQAGIVLSPGTIFGVDGGGAGYLRLALVPPIDECRQAIEIWRGLL